MGGNGVKVTVFGQGSWRMEDDDRPACIAALREGLDLGLTHLDTAELYGRGLVESAVVGKAIEGRRDQVYLVSKVMPHNATAEGTIEACERSLERLGTDRLDLYLLHWPGEHPFAETLKGFEALKAAGKIRAYGVSNFDVPDLEEAVGLAGEGKIACNQVLYHLGERSIEHAVIPWCEAHGIAVVAYSPFGAGQFPSASTAGGRVLEEVADAHGATARQVALRFLVRRPSVFAIPKHASVEHAVDNAGASGLTLSAEELEKIDRAFPLQRNRGLQTL